MSLIDIVNEYEFYDKINKEKLYIDYMQEKELDYLKYIYLQSLNVDPYELVYENNSEINIDKIDKNSLISLISKNQKKDIENKLNVLTEEYLVIIRVIIENKGYLELIESGIVNDIDLIAILRNIGFIFVGYEKDKLLVHMPKDIYEKIYKIFSNEKIKELSDTIEKNTILYKIIEGIVIAYGTITYDEVFDIIFEEYPEMSIDKMYSILFFGSYILNKSYYMEENIISYTKEIVDIFFYNEDYDLKHFKIKDFVSLANHSYYRNMLEYKVLKEYLKKYIKNNNDVVEVTEKILNVFWFSEQVAPGSGALYLEMNINSLLDKKIENIEKIKEILNSIIIKMPKWNYNGYSIQEKEKKEENNNISKNKVYELNIKIKDIKPSIIRKIQVSSEMSLNQLAAVIIIIFYWSGYSEYAFKVGRTKYYKEIKKDNNLLGFTIEDAFENNKKIKFLYNINNSNKEIEHEIEINNIYYTDIELKYPKCIQAKEKLDILSLNFKCRDNILIQELSMFDIVYLIELNEKNIKKQTKKDLVTYINSNLIEYLKLSDWLLLKLEDKINKETIEKVKEKYNNYINYINNKNNTL